ncbi:hypothetical protein ACHAXT_005243 [Thalassiosira profunda]
MRSAAATRRRGMARHLVLAVALILSVEASSAGRSSSTLRRPSQSLLQPTNVIDASRRRSNGDSLPDSGEAASGLAFVHRARRERKSCQAVGCTEASAPLQMNSDATRALGSLDRVLSLRGGASSSNNAVQGILKSILDAPSMPAPIKRIIEMICQFVEGLTGWEILPRAEPKKSKAKKKSKPKEKEVLVEKIGGGAKKKRRSKQNDVQMAAAKKKKRKSAVDGATASDTDEADATTSKEEPAATTAPPKKQKPKRPDAASQKFLANKIKSSNPNYRIQRELKEFLSAPPPGLSVKISGKNVRLWVVTLAMPDNTIYAGETYKLRVQFPNDYPTSPPSVYFLPPTPRHEHVYTNGDICLSLLGKDWRPIMTAQSIAQAIMSILCGAQRKSLPMDNARHAGNKPGKKQDDWVYHDDNC